ncbi:MAG TPA: hypothetical protein PLE85_03280 [Bacteroidales bacterium]|nr:hypothetical protein [Lentimicrobiaceae bacterium]HOH99541.1 hypothetical protein [Bacteroidales bacterium]
MKYLIIAGALLMLLLTSCGSTRLIADNQRAEIYVDGRFQGMGTAYIPRTGIPVKATVSTFMKGRQTGEVEIKRHFTGTTFLLGWITYGTGFFWGWRYPREIYIPANRRSEEDPQQNIWMKPPGSPRE